MAIDIQAVTDCIEAAARTLVLPRFSRLAAGDVESKVTPGDSDDVVTIVDHEVETSLSKALTAIEPAARVIGEEAAHRRPELLDALASDQPLWIIDPIDGTKNFAAGDTAFGIMAAYVVAGRTRSAWAALPARGQTVVAEAGSGTFMNGERLRVPPRASENSPRGAAMVRYMPEELRRHVTDALHTGTRHMQPSGSAAVEYTDFLPGRCEFVVHDRLLPWHRPAPALVLREADGYVPPIERQAYSPRSKHPVTLAASGTRQTGCATGWGGHEASIPISRGSVGDPGLIAFGSQTVGAASSVTHGPGKPTFRSAIGKNATGRLQRLAGAAVVAASRLAGCSGQDRRCVLRKSATRPLRAATRSNPSTTTSSAPRMQSSSGSGPNGQRQIVPRRWPRARPGRCAESGPVGRP